MKTPSHTDKTHTDKKKWQVYLLECADRTYYCGVTTDLEARIRHHNRGEASKYTRSRLPVTCIAASPFMDKSCAFALEYRIKRLPRARKKTWVEKGSCPGP